MRRAALNLLGEDEGAQRATASVLLRVGNNGYFGQVWSVPTGCNVTPQRRVCGAVCLMRRKSITHLSIASRVYHIYQWHRASINGISQPDAIELIDA